MVTKAELKDICTGMPFYARVRAGKSWSRCSEFCRDLEAEFESRGIQSIVVGSEDPRGFLIHNFMFAATDDGVVIVDPSIGQFIEGYNDVFMGTRAELLAIAHAHNPNGKWDAYWAPDPLLAAGDKPSLIPPTRAAAKAFQKKWGSTGTRQFKDFIPQVASQILRYGAAGRNWRGYVKANYIYDEAALTRLEAEMARQKAASTAPAPKFTV